MYSGSDSNESQKFPNWTLNPASYQNMANDQVDWAALAQQWIIMKESGPPPVPGETQTSYSKESKKDDKIVNSSTETQRGKSQPPVGALWNVNEPPPPPGADYWNAQNPNWNWNNSWVSPSVPPPPTIGPLKAPLLPTPGNTYGITPEIESDNSVQYGNEYTSSSGGYWTAPPTEPVTATKHIKPHNKRYSKVNVPVRVSAPLPPVSDSSTPTLDANKRKQLPAWIREGLEKMEKDKMKQLEKEKQKKQREEYIEKNKKDDKETMEILRSTMRERQKSKFESDGEESDDEPKPRSKAPSPDPVALTPDELMIKVRRTMTEILLNVTGRQIETICREELQRFLKKHKASDLRSAAPTGGANLSAKLGLGMYGEGSESSSDEDDDRSRSNSRDSDDDLKETIRRKKVDFQRTEREIEERLVDVERPKNESRSRSTSPESNDNDSQVDARVEDQKYNYSSPVNKSYEKSKNKSPASYSDASDYSNDRSQKSRRSTSSESNESYKKSKTKYRSKSRSYSPDRRHRTSRWSRSKSPVRDRDSTGSRRDSASSRKRSSRRSRSSSYSRSRRSRSSSYRRSRRSTSRDRLRRTRSRSSSRSRYSSSRSEKKRRRRSRSDSSSRGKRSHRH